MKSLSFYKTSLIFLIAILASSCSVVKQNGMYQTKRYKTTNRTQFHKNGKLVKLPEVKEDETLVNDVLGKRIVKALNSETLAESKKSNQEKSNFGNSEQETKTSNTENRQKQYDEDNTKKKLMQPIDDSCDLMVLKNGDEHFVIVLEISPTEIRYKRCDNLSGPTHIIYKKDVLFVKYNTGIKEVFTEKEVSAQETKTNNTSNPIPRALGSILIFLGILVALFVSILLGLMAIGIGLLLRAAGK